LKKTAKPKRPGKVEGKSRAASLGSNNLGEKGKLARLMPPPRGSVFVVDDNALLVECTAGLLEAEGYTVKPFSDPKALLQAMEKAPAEPVVLVTDYDMGEWNGLDLIENCRKICPKLKTILMSGTVDSSISATHTAKVHHFLSKPYAPAELKRIVAELMQS
jgi:DNA-binding NtrC family response regulator